MSTPSREQLLGELRELDTSHVSDALDKLAINGQCAGLLPLTRESRVAGVAFTVRYVPVGASGGTVGDYIDDLEPGTVVAIDNAGRVDTTVWGDLLTATAARRDLAGTVIDGTCRDTDRAVELSYPVYAKHRWMRTGKDRVRVDGYDVAVNIGGVLVEPGDYFVGDADGVVVIPKSRIEQVVDVARAIRHAEDGIRELIDSGQSLAQARETYGYHALQTADPRKP